MPDSHKLPFVTYLFLALTIYASLAQETQLIEFPIEVSSNSHSPDTSLHQLTDSSHGKRDNPLGGGPTVLGTYFIEVKANGQNLRLQLDTGSYITYLPSDTCQIYDGSQVVTACTFYNQPISIRNTAESGCNPTSCKTCDGGCLLASEYQDSSGVAAIGRSVNVGLGTINATSVCGLVFRSTKKFRYDRGTQIDGLIGLGYSPEGGFPTVVDSWIAQNKLSDVFSIQLGPRGGAFSLGGYNPNYFTGDIQWTPILPSAHWYQVPLLSISVQGSKVKFSRNEKKAKTIVDSGTTHLLVPTATFDKITQKITTHVRKSTPTVPASINAGWENSFFNNAICHTDVDLNWLPNIQFEFKRKLSAAEKKAKVSKSFTLTMKPEDYLYLRTTAEGKPCYSYGIGKGSNSMFIFGDTFMTSYYSIFDRQNGRLGFAYSSKSSTVSPTNEPITIAQIPEFASAPDSLVPKLSFLIIISLALFLVIM